MRVAVALLLVSGCVESAPAPEPPPPEPRDCPTPDGARRVIKLSIGTDETAALINDGSVYYWGKDTSGETANIDSYGWTVYEPTPSPELSCLVDIDLGSSSGCGVDPLGEVVCWGHLPTLSFDLPAGGHPGFVPTRFPVFDGAEQLCLGPLLIGAIVAGDEQPVIYGAWSSVPGIDDYQDPPGWPFGEEPRFVELPTSGGPECGIDPQGYAWCFGANDWGEVGDGTTEYAYEPKRVVGLEDVVEIGEAHERRCARLADGRVACWGKGPLGDGSTEDDISTVPVFIEGMDDAVSLTVGRSVNCAAHAAGDVSCWGNHNSAREGGGNSDTILIPAPVGLDAFATQVVTSWDHSCALTEGGNVYCWGYGPRLGVGSSIGENTAPTPQRVHFPFEL